MNKSLQWILLCVVIFISVIIIDQNINGLKHPRANLFVIKMINIGAAITLVIFLLVLLGVKLKKHKK